MLSKGFANQITVFRRKLFHLMNSGIDGSKFYLYGPYSGHLGKYSKNCSFTSFFNFSNPKKIQKRFKNKGYIAEYMNAFNFVKKLKFINSNPSVFEEKSVFIPFTSDDIRVFNKSKKSKPKNYFFEFLVDKNITKTIFLPILAQGSYISKFRFFDFFKFNKYLFEISKLIIETNLNSKSFLTLHARLGDFKSHCLIKKYNKTCFLEKSEYINYINYLSIKTKSKVFVISNEYFDSNSNLFNLNETFLEKFLIQNSFSRFECLKKNIKYTKMFVEMIITCFSKEFYYNEFSTLSSQIILICEYIGLNPKISSIQNAFRYF